MRYGIADERLIGIDLAEGTVGIDAGLTLTKIVRADGGTVVGRVFARDDAVLLSEARRIGVTGARAAAAGIAGGAAVHEIDAAAQGALALMRADGAAAPDRFVLGLLGTGTAFAAVRPSDGEIKVAHLGGTALGGGSFWGIAQRIAPGLTFVEAIEGAHRGDRRAVDVMISEAYPEGLGRVGPDLTAAHLASECEGTIDDVLAGLLNLHGESIGQIAASRALIAQLPRVVLAGGFAHGNERLVQSIASMCGLFGVAVDVTPTPGYAGALGAAIIASPAREQPHG